MKTLATFLLTTVLSFGIASDTMAQTVDISAFPRHPVPVDLTAEDFITKVYGVLSPDRSRDELCDDCVKLLNLMPSEDQMGLWLDSADGYQLSYYGQRRKCIRHGCHRTRFRGEFRLLLPVPL